MKPIALCLLFLCVISTAMSGQTTASIDTTIYNVVENWPYALLKSCAPGRHPGWTEDSTRRCADAQLLAIVTQNMRYPEPARENNVEGTVVTSFVIEKSGRMTNFKLLKDIGSGCGDEALRVLKALDTIGLRWQPARTGGAEVRMRMTLPLRFKLQEALPYYLSDNGDTIYTNYEVAPAFKPGNDSLVSFLINRLEYPAEYNDSCKTGIIEMAVLIRNNGELQVDNQLDFSNLGLDFQFQALRLVNRTMGLWMPAQYLGRGVSTTLPLRVLFKSDAPKCAAVNQIFDQTMVLADEGAVLLEKNEPEQAIAKWTEAIKLNPNNTEILYYRGTALLNLNRKEEACQDFGAVKKLLGVTWFEGVRRLVCGWQ